jgi:hypothetical protein
VQLADLVKLDAGTTTTPSAGGRDFDSGDSGGRHSPKRCGASMAEQGPVATRQHRGDPVAMAGQPRMADGVDAAVNEVQPSRVETVSDRSTIQPERRKLPTRDNSVLTSREGRHGTIQGPSHRPLSPLDDLVHLCHAESHPRRLTRPWKPTEGDE